VHWTSARKARKKIQENQPRLCRDIMAEHLAGFSLE
jgi:hypothetical protein